MNIQLLSNTINKFNSVNLTNKFNVKIQQPIDAENQDKFIRVLDVSYPNTTNNIKKDQLFFYFKIFYANFNPNRGIDQNNNGPIYNTAPNYGDSLEEGEDGYKNEAYNILKRDEIGFHSKKIDIPKGIYNIKDILDYINTYTNDYDINFNLLKNGHVQITTAFNERYLVQDVSSSFSIHDKKYNRFRYNDLWTNRDITLDATDAIKIRRYPNDVIWGGCRIELYLSNDLHWILGEFEESKKIFMDIYSRNVFKIQLFTNEGLYAEKRLNTQYLMRYNEKTKLVKNYHEITAKNLPNEFNGVDKIFIYCEEIMKTFVGDSFTNLLCIIPLKRDKNMSIGEIIQYRPTNAIKKLIPKKISEFNITLKDSTNELINFDSGSVNINCLII